MGAGNDAPGFRDWCLASWQAACDTLQETVAVVMACWSDMQLAAALRAQGVSAGSAAILVAVSHPESGGCGVMQQGQPYSTTGWGPWQITPGNSESQCGSNGELNSSLTASACAAAAKLRGGGLNQWTTFTSGKYVPFLSGAKSAVAQVYGMSAQEVQKLINSAPAGGSQNAQTTGLFGFPGDIFGGLVGDIFKGLGLPNPKDALIRLGLILLGGFVILVGILILAGKQNITSAITLAAPETRAAEVASGATGRQRRASTERSARRREAEASHDRAERRMDRELSRRASE